MVFERTVKVNDNLEAAGRGPTNGLGQVRKLSLDVGFASTDVECPISDGNSNMIESNKT
jgi:hypothetical protein